jgi:hypothetical protein
MGNNVYKLLLPKDLSRLHPVFHSFLLLPFVDPKTFPGRIGSKAPRGPSSLTTLFYREEEVEALLGYQQPAKNVHKYLVRWQGGSTADKSWERGWRFYPSIHLYMEKIHNEFGAENIILPPEKIQRIPC